MKSFYKYKIKIIYVSISLILISLSLSGSDCEKVLQNINVNVSQEILGSWKLNAQTGALQDICNDETVNFQSTGIAVLTCPNSSSISRGFSVDNSVLTYTQTSVSYDVEFSNSNQTLTLFGRNVSRNLRYLKIITDSHVFVPNKKIDLNNSSEKEK